MEFFHAATINQQNTDTKFEVAPRSSEYRMLPITQGFDWPDIIRRAAERSRLGDVPLYLVVFRSLRRAGADGELITRLYAVAHEEAKLSEALLHYFAGELDEAGRAMSWCLWTGQGEARRALSGQAHREAVRHADEFYEQFSIELYKVHIFNEKDELEVIFEPVTRPEGGALLSESLGRSD